jgi:GNAT superfamily N-acetyltransferase
MIMEVIIREANPSDAARMIGYMNRLSEEPDSNIEISPGEFNRPVEEEAGFLAEFAASEHSVFFVAEAGGKIVGVLNCKGSNRKAIRHAVTLGMSVDQDWRGKGIGSRLMACAIEWAKNTRTIKRIELPPSSEIRLPFICIRSLDSRSRAGGEKRVFATVNTWTV